MRREAEQRQGSVMNLKWVNDVSAKRVDHGKLNLICIIGSTEGKREVV